MRVSKRETNESITPDSDNLRLDEQRVAVLLDAATEVFLEHGFEGASTNDIARRANCSKTTLYSRFATKQDLFIAVLERRTEAIFKQVFMALPADGPIEDALIEFGSRVLRITLSDKQIRLQRVISMEAERFPELSQRFFELGPTRGYEELSRYLNEQIKREYLVKEDPRLMAEHLIGLITSGPVHWTVLGVSNNLSAKDRSKRLHAAVRTFLRAYSTEHGQSS
jgi:TetR/AcrR family transcriptional regulator of autoinduction and epiphytic fitness